MKTLLLSSLCGGLLLGGFSTTPLLAQSDGLPRGAYDVPYTRYESEDATRGGGAVLRSSPAFVQAAIASEASNQKYVALAATGSSVSWPVSKGGAGVDLRFTLPDSPDGAGVPGSLNLYVNGALAKTINLSSYWSWQYFANGSGDPVNAPGGRAFMRFDEVHFRLNMPLKAGDVVKIQKDNSDAYEYGVDFIEVEDVPAALPKPAGYLAVTDYGAVPDDGKDDLAAFNQCLKAAQAAGTGMYIPAGSFTLAATWRPEGALAGIKGAGMWYSNLNFSTNAFFSGGILARLTNVEISGLYLSTANNARQENGQARIYKCFMGTYGANSYIHDIWEEHFECGFWIGGYDAPLPVPVTTKLRLSHNRIRNNYADGSNFAQGTNNSTVEFCSVRNNGDDGVASWSSTDSGVTTICENNTFNNNTIENNWRAGGIGVFGGRNHYIHHNTVTDGVAGSGIRFTTEFPGFKFENNDNMRVAEMTITNCGTSEDLFGQERGAIDFFAAGEPVKNITYTNVNVLNAQRHGVQIGATTVDNITFNSLSINGTGRDNFTSAKFTSPIGGLAILSFASTGTATFNSLALANIEVSPPTLKTQQSYNLIIKTGPPVAPTGVSISPATVSVREGQTAQLTATVTPDNATNSLVNWRSSDTTVVRVSTAGLVTGVKTGTATITATTQSGGKTATRTVTVTPGPPVITSSATATGAVGANFTYAITATNSPTSYAATGLPAGLSLNASTGAITGRPTTMGTFTATLSATTSVGTGTKQVVFTIGAAPTAPVITSAGTASGTVNAPFRYAITASQGPTSYGATNLPAGLSVNSTTGVISGTVAATGTFNATITASSSLGAGSKALVITISTAPACTAPVIGFTSTAPVIDQSVDAVWSSVPAGSFNNVTIGARPADFAGSRWRALYDATNLYVLVEVKDQATFNDSGTAWWNDDAVELFIDGDNSKGATYDDVNDFQLAFRYNDASVQVGGNSVTRTAGIVFAIQNVAGGYNVEARIPWSTIGVTPQVGQQIGFDVAVDDDDNDGDRDAQVAAFATTAQGYVNPSVFGSVYLTTCGGTTNPVAVTGVSVSPATMALNVGATRQLTATVAPANATNQSVTWTTSNAGVATVSSGGLITAVAGGSATITATTQEGGKTASSVVTVNGGPAPGTISSAQATGPIVVNGSLSEAGWVLNQTVSKTVSGTPNNTVTFGTQWDNTNLYIGAKVLDANLFADSPDAWDDDAIEIYIDANNNKLGTYDGRDNQIIQGYNRATVFTKVSLTGLQHAWAAVSGGYTVELAIPWAQLGISAPAAGTTIGFDLGYDDDDNGGGRDGQAVWRGTGNNYASTADFGTLVLSNTAANRAAATAASTDATSQVSYWPVPVEQKLYVAAAGTYTRVAVYDMLGQVVYQDASIAGQTALTLNLRHLAAGVYFVKLEGGPKPAGFRITKN